MAKTITAAYSMSAIRPVVIGGSSVGRVWSAVLCISEEKFRHLLDAQVAAQEIVASQDRPLPEVDRPWVTPPRLAQSESLTVGHPAQTVLADLLVSHPGSPMLETMPEMILEAMLEAMPAKV